MEERDVIERWNCFRGKLWSFWTDLYGELRSVLDRRGLWTSLPRTMAEHNEQKRCVCSVRTLLTLMEIDSESGKERLCYVRYV